MPVEELPSSRAQAWEHVLEIGSRGRHPAEGRYVEKAAAPDEEGYGGETASDLEPSAGDVLVREPIRRHVESWPQQNRPDPRPDQRTGRRPRCDMERHDHVAPKTRPVEANPRSLAHPEEAGSLDGGHGGPGDSATPRRADEDELTRQSLSLQAVSQTMSGRLLNCQLQSTVRGLAPTSGASGWALGSAITRALRGSVQERRARPRARRDGCRDRPEW